MGLPVDEAERQIQTTRVPTLQVSSESVANTIERFGWTKSVAGEADFDKACRAISAMFTRARGLFITGGAGVGKTQLLRTMLRSLKRDGSIWYYCKSPDDMYALRSMDCDALNDTVFIDDIGAEEIIREYGNVVDVIGDFVQRYHYRGRGRFMATSNLNSQQLNERYGTIQHAPP